MGWSTNEKYSIRHVEPRKRGLRRRTRSRNRTRRKRRPRRARSGRIRKLIERIKHRYSQTYLEGEIGKKGELISQETGTQINCRARRERA